MKSMTKKFQVRVFAALVLLMGIGVAVVFMRGSDDFPAGKPGAETTVHIANGQSGSEIAVTLKNAFVVKSTTSFLKVAIADPRSRSIAPGTHRINTHLSAKAALEQMLEAQRIVGLINVKEGSTLSDVVALLATNSSISKSKFSSWKLVKPPIVNAKSSLEGMLFPAQYSFEQGTSAQTAITAMSQRFTEVLRSSHLNNGLQKYDSYQILTIASMIQVEGDTSDFAKIARVILNRLSIGMPLQLNSTVQFAANLRGQIALSTASTKIDSPYNTYRNVGLPPTPISNPGLAAIDAALHPADGNWIYFITVKPGDTRFTNSFSEFGGWEVLFHKNLAAGAFK
jgi:UPF0755 protein